MLIFSMQGSGNFQGVASLVGENPSETCSDLVAPNLGSPLPIKWLKYGDIPFQATRHLMNPYNDGRNVQTSRDGQVTILHCFILSHCTGCIEEKNYVYCRSWNPMLHFIFAVCGIGTPS